MLSLNCIGLSGLGRLAYRIGDGQNMHSIERQSCDRHHVWSDFRNDRVD
jgi:hypothetical protein